MQALPSTDDGTLNSYLSGSVAAHPDRPAVSDRHSRLTYAQLDELSSRVAAVFGEREPLPGTRIALWLNKSVETVAAIYAVLRCGAVYVPVDPTAPSRRGLPCRREPLPAWVSPTGMPVAAQKSASASCAPE